MCLTTILPSALTLPNCPRLKVSAFLAIRIEVKKTMDEETVAKIKAENEGIRKLRDKAIEEICMRFSCFKRDFLGAPIRKALINLQKGTISPADQCELPYRMDEKLWVNVSQTEVSVSFGLNFDNPTDKALARIFLLVRLPYFKLSVGIF